MLNTILQNMYLSWVGFYSVYDSTFSHWECLLFIVIGADVISSLYFVSGRSSDAFRDTVAGDFVTCPNDITVHFLLLFCVLLSTCITYYMQLPHVYNYKLMYM